MTDHDAELAEYLKAMQETGGEIYTEDFVSGFEHALEMIAAYEIDAAHAEPEPMKRGRTEAETCRLNGWEVGTCVRGHEEWGGVSRRRVGGEVVGPRSGVWNTWRITAIGEEKVLARTIRTEYTLHGILNGEAHDDVSREHIVTFSQREWVRVDG